MDVMTPACVSARSDSAYGTLRSYHAGIMARRPIHRRIGRIHADPPPPRTHARTSRANHFLLNMKSAFASA
jgi:hypothetical protein